MATLNQFYKGEDIPITVRQYDGESMDGLSMLVYPDNTDLTKISSIPKITVVPQPTETEGVYSFNIPDSVTINMEAGSYTVELYYGQRTIVKMSSKFILVDSGYALINKENT